MNVLLTGVSKGLGLEIAKQLLMQNHTVYGISRTKTEQLQNLENEYPEKLKFLSFDLSKTDEAKKQIFTSFVNYDTKIDAFINNAALAYDDLVTNLNISKLQKMYSVNVFTPMLMCKEVIKNMIYNKTEGAILHISSISAHTGYKGLAMYASSKAALEGFSKNTAREWGSKQIRSNCLVSGFMNTDMSKSLTADQKNRIYKRTALKAPVLPESAAASAIFLISDAAKSITGQNIFVDSGTI